MTSTIVMIVFLFFAVGMTLYFVTIYNGLVSLKNEIERAWANIDVLLKQRFDEIPKIISVVESYSQYEQNTLDKLFKAREHYFGSKSVNEKAQSSNELSSALKGVFALGEAYPELKANQNFLQLQSRISTLEESLADRREFYNSATTNYNTRIEQIPDVFVARSLNYQRKELFQVSNEERQDVQVKIKLPS